MILNAILQAIRSQSTDANTKSAGKQAAGLAMFADGLVGLENPLDGKQSRLGVGQALSMAFVGLIMVVVSRGIANSMQDGDSSAAAGWIAWGVTALGVLLLLIGIGTFIVRMITMVTGAKLILDGHKERKEAGDDRSMVSALMDGADGMVENLSENLSAAVGTAKKSSVPVPPQLAGPAASTAGAASGTAVPETMADSPAVTGAESEATFAATADHIADAATVSAATVSAAAADFEPAMATADTADTAVRMEPMLESGTDLAAATDFTTDPFAGAEFEADTGAATDHSYTGHSYADAEADGGDHIDHSAEAEMAYAATAAHSTVPLSTAEAMRTTRRTSSVVGQRQQAVSQTAAGQTQHAAMTAAATGQAQQAHQTAAAADTAAATTSTSTSTYAGTAATATEASATSTDADAAALPRAGWYPDPLGNGYRWWDGQGWTDHLHDPQ